MSDSIYGNLHPLSLGLDERLQNDNIKINLFKISRLAKLIESLRDEKFNLLSVGTKRMLIESILDINSESELNGLNKITAILFSTPMSSNEKSTGYPAPLMIYLVKALRMERQDDIKACILKIFLKKGELIPKYLNLEDIIFALFSTDSIFRHRMIICITKYYNQSDVLSILLEMMKRTGGQVPGKVLNTIIANGELNDLLEKKRELLFPDDDTRQLNNSDLERLWEEYLHSLNRFGLIRTLSLNSWQSMWKMTFEKEAVQLSLNFNKSNIIEQSAFNKRIQAIKGL
jgi:hypothetical protein